MFSVYICNTAYTKDRILIYDDTRSDEDELKLITPKLTMEVNQAGSFEFGIPVTNVGYDSLEPMISEILVIREDPGTVSSTKWRGDIIWFGRVISVSTDVWKTKQCYCEGGLSYLNDVIASDFSTAKDLSKVTIGEMLFTRTKNSQDPNHYNVYPDNDICGQLRKYCKAGYGSNEQSHYLKYLGYGVKNETTHNDVWEVEPVIYAGGSLDVEYFYNHKQGLSTWNDLSIIELLTNAIGDTGYYWVEKSSANITGYTNQIMVNQLHIARSYTSFDENRHQTFSFGENIIDYIKNDDMTDIYTAVHPYGTAEGEDHTTSLRKDISDDFMTYNKKIKLKHSKDYPGIIYRPDLVTRYGVVIKNIDVGTYIAQEQLISCALDYFDTQNYIETEIEKDGKTRIVTFRELEIQAADMGMMGADYSLIRLMDPVHVLSEPHDVDLYAHVTKIEIDMQSPENSVYTINSSTNGSSMYNGTGSSVTGGSTPSGLSYTHPRHTEHDLGLWKFSNDNLGHVSGAQAVSKKDITDLGIPGEDTKYYVSSSRNPDVHGVTLTDSKNKTSVAPLETYRRTLPLKSYSDDGEYVNGRGYLIYTTGFQIKSEYGRFDASHPLNIEGRYTLTEDKIDHKWNINGDITANGNTVILNLKTDTADSDLSLNVYAYGYFEKATDGHEYVLYHVWLAVYISKDLTGLSYTTAVLSSIQYTDMEGLYLQSPPDSDHAINYSKLVKQTENTSSENTKYELSKTGSTITLTGSDGTSSSVTDSDTVYVHPKFTEYANGFYKVTVNDEGHITDTENVTASDLYNAGGVIQSTLNLYDYEGYIPLSFMTLFYGGNLKDKAEMYFSNRDGNHRRYIRLCLGGHNDISTGCLNLIDYNGCQYILEPNPDSPGMQAYDFYFPKQSGTLALTKDIPDISGKQDKSTAVTHTANTAVGSATKPVYIAANGAATAISHSINADVPANAKFTDTTYSDATQSAHGLMTAADKKKLDGMDLSKYLPLAGGVMSGDIDMQTNKRDILVGTQKATTSDGTAVAGGAITTTGNFTDIVKARRSFIGSVIDNYNKKWYNAISLRHRNGHNDGANYGMYIRSVLTEGGSLIWNKQTAADTWQGERTLLDSVNYPSYAAKSSHTHEMIVNNSKLISGSNNAAQWCRLGTLISFENFSTAIISVWSGDGANGLAAQNSWFEIHIKDAWQSTASTASACGVTVYRTRCGTVKVKVIPTAHNAFTVWVYLPWAYWNGNYAVNGRYKTWTSDFKNQPTEPEGTGANTAYYDQAFLTSTVAKASEATTLTDSGWVGLNQNPATAASQNTVRYRKYGNIVYLHGSFRPQTPTANPRCGAVDDDCKPSENVVMTGWIRDTGEHFGIIVGTDGIILLKSPGNASNFFIPNKRIDIDCSYII